MKRSPVEALAVAVVALVIAGVVAGWPTHVLVILLAVAVFLTLVVAGAALWQVRELLCHLRDLKARRER